MKDERKTKKPGEFSNWEFQKLYDFLFMFKEAPGDEQDVPLNKRELSIILKLVGGQIV